MMRMADLLRALLLVASALVFLFAAAVVSMFLPWSLPVVLAVVAGGAYWGYRSQRPITLQQRRRAGGQCLSCGYDLRGNVSGVCPECGNSK
jgi:hypothetical protein